MAKQSRHSPIILLVSFLAFTRCASTPPGWELPAKQDPIEEISKLYEKGEHRMALRHLDLLLKKDPDAPKLNYLRGEILLQLKDFEEARQSLEISQREVPLLTDYVLFSIAESYRYQNKWDQAIQNYQELLQNYPLSRYQTEASVALANTLLITGEAQKAWETLVPILGKVQEGMALKTLSTAAQAAELSNNPEALNLWQRLWIEFPNTEEAEIANLRLKKAERLQSSVYYARALNLMKEYDYEKACPLFHKAVKMSAEEGGTETSPMKLSYGKCLYQSKELEAALKIFQEIYWKETTSDQREEALFWLGKTYNRLDQSDLAQSSYEELLHLYPNGLKAPTTLANLAFLKHATEDEEGSKALWKRLVLEYPDAPQAREARWRLGWSAFQGENYSEAIGYFEQVFNAPSSSIMERTQNLFWMARSYDILGKKEKTKEIEQYILSQLPPNYYSLLLVQMGYRAPFGKRTETVLYPPPFSSSVPIPLLTSQEARFHWERFKVLYELFLFEDAAVELKLLELATPQDRKTATWLSQQWLRMENYHQSQRVVRLFFQDTLQKPITHDEISTWNLAYSKGFQPLVERYSKEQELDPLLVYSLIQEESRFQADALSSSRAYGLMQIIPKTGNYLARRAGLREFSPEQLHDPETNIRLGTAYLRELIDDFSGNWMLALAGYNGGPHSVKKWLQMNGHHSLAEFVEEIPFRETRNYVKKVLTSYAIYSQIYGGGILHEPSVPPEQNQAFWTPIHSSTLFHVDFK